MAAGAWARLHSLLRAPHPWAGNHREGKKLLKSCNRWADFRGAWTRLPICGPHSPRASTVSSGVSTILPFARIFPLWRLFPAQLPDHYNCCERPTPSFPMDPLDLLQRLGEPATLDSFGTTALPPSQQEYDRFSLTVLGPENDSNGGKDGIPPMPKRGGPSKRAQVGRRRHRRLPGGGAMIGSGPSPGTMPQ